MRADCEATSHLMGMFYHSIWMCDNSIYPMYVCYGNPLQMKAGELEKTRKKRDEARAVLEKV